jgi:hypothetical protein
MRKTIILFMLFLLCACSTSAPAVVATAETGSNLASSGELLISTVEFPTATLPAPTPKPTEAPTHTPMLPTATSLPDAPAATLAPPTPSCTNELLMVKHLSVGNNTILQPGAMMGKIWRIQNTGTCTWTTGYKLVWVEGSHLSATSSVDLPVEVPPGGAIDLRVTITAPQTFGQAADQWQLQAPDGTLFGEIRVVIYVPDPSKKPPYLCG